jgi:hypothetical protein
MMDERRVLVALEGKREQLLQEQSVLAEERLSLEQALATSLPLSRAAATERLAPIRWPGARPTVDWDIFSGLVVSFPHHWTDHRQAREWARETLEGSATFAVDGSQIPASREISLPLALVQIGWFENPHTAHGRYTKEIAIELLTAAELRHENGRRLAFADEIVNGRRFQGEIGRLISYIESHARTEPKPLCFYDGSLVVSFIQQLHPVYQRQYIQAVNALLAASKRCRVPLAGFVDTSYANDLATMLQHLSGADPVSISDAALLRPLMAWGDRSQVFVCARDDGVVERVEEHIYFAYLKTTAANPPARVEFPRWVCDSGEHERLLDLVRAECVVGLGYPYVIETADATAVLTQEDRERFLALLQQFSEHNGIPLRFSRKGVSKRYRR